MRRFRRHSRRAGGSRRKIRWVGSHLFTGALTFNDEQGVTWWVKQPGNTVNLDLATLGLEPSDETLVRTIWNQFAGIQNGAALTSVGFFTFGIIAWDERNPETLEAVQ